MDRNRVPALILALNILLCSVYANSFTRGEVQKLLSSNSPPPSGQGFTGDFCTETTDCQEGRICWTFFGAECKLGSLENMCFCEPANPEDFFCDCKTPCRSGEECVDGKAPVDDLAGIISGVCVSSTVVSKEKFPLYSCSDQTDGEDDLDEPISTPEETEEGTASGELDEESSGPTVSSSDPKPYNGTDATPVPTTAPSPPSPSPSAGVCIDAELLSHFKPHELVFENHPTARVLCDPSGSCATKGHIVHYNGSVMMMSSYCDVVGCEEREMEVNSPRYRRGLKVESKSDGMRFTAFAARYETKTEEAVLSTAVHIGL